jgi:hypothetical protein
MYKQFFNIKQGAYDTPLDIDNINILNEDESETRPNIITELKKNLLLYKMLYNFDS